MRGTASRSVRCGPGLSIALALANALAACNGDDADGPAGAACARAGDCGALACVADREADAEDLAPLPLVCGSAAEGGDPGEACEEAGDCALGICLLAGACARPCEAAGDCGERERCATAFARRDGGALQPLSACVAVANLPDSASVAIEVREGALEPAANAIELEPVASDETALYVLESSEDRWPEGVRCRPPLCARALRTRDRTPVTLFDASLDYGRAPAPSNPVAIGDHLIAPVVMLPIGSRDVLSDAGYTIDLGAENEGDLLVTRLSGAGGGQRLDLNVFYVGARDFAPQGDRGPPLLAEALDVVDEILGQADIFIGDVRQIEVTGSLPMVGTAYPEGDATQGFAVMRVRFGVYVELPGLFRLSAGAGNSAINLFFLADIHARGSADGEPEAEAGGIPGPLGMHGTGSSGIAIATDMMAGAPTELGRTLAHEIAHYLGLFHTSEADGSVFDPLSDTPECRRDQALNGDRLDVEDCLGAGAENLMFWAKTTGTVLTEQQRAVLRRALILQ